MVDWAARRVFQTQRDVKRSALRPGKVGELLGEQRADEIPESRVRESRF
jgi:hypothetical protein